MISSRPDEDFTARTILYAMTGQVQTGIRGQG
jgi:hypothetical protein